jgi:hypothetical protein
VALLCCCCFLLLALFELQLAALGTIFLLLPCTAKTLCYKQQQQQQ